MHRLKWLALLPVALIVVVFSVANRQFVTISFEPLPGAIELPLFAVGFAGIAAGFVLGAIGAWWAGRGRRKQARADRRSLRELTKKVSARGGALQLREATPTKVESLAREQ
jgi:uncharacterized integral membrane protein